jgi:hypothetical protein
VRVTLPLRRTPRTPACPGFGVSGDRKRACFDGSGCSRGVSPLRGLTGLPGRWGPRDADDAGHRDRTQMHGFERVQMRVAGGKVLEALTGTGWPLPIERVQMGCAGGTFGCWEPCPLGSFERVQMTSAWAPCPACGTLAHRGSDRQSQRTLGSRSASSAPVNEFRFPTHLITGECLCHP